MKYVIFASKGKRVSRKVVKPLILYLKAFLSLENAFKELEAHAKEIKNEIKALEKKGYTTNKLILY